MAEYEKGSMPVMLGENDITLIHFAITRGGVVHFLTNPDFSALGIFEILDRKQARRGSLSLRPDSFFCWKLLEHDPATERLGIDRECGHLLVHDQSGSQIDSILPAMIRFVERFQVYEGIVGESGYVLPNPDFLFTEERQHFSVAKLEEMLLQVDQGYKPPVFDFGQTYARVDSNLAGERLEVVVFKASLAADKEPWERDAVAIHPKTRTLVPRTVSQPFAYGKWVKTPQP